MCNLGVIGPMTVLHRCRLFLGSRLFLPLHRHHRQCRKDPVAGIQFHGHSSETPCPSAGAVHRTGPTKSGVSVLAKTPSRKPAACPVRFAVASFALLVHAGRSAAGSGNGNAGQPMRWPCKASS